MRATTERGSIAGFVIVAVALVLVAAGAMYWAKQQPQSDSPEVTISEPAQDEAADKASPGSDKPSSETTDQDDGRTSDSTTDTSSDTATGTSETEGAVNEYSETGPADNAMQVVASGALTAAGAAYVTSRRRSQL